MQKAAECLQIAEKQVPTKKRKKTFRKLSETLRFQNDEILEALSASLRHSDFCK